MGWKRGVPSMEKALENLCAKENRTTPSPISFAIQQAKVGTLHCFKALSRTVEDV
jgi:hypothetical protein